MYLNLNIIMLIVREIFADLDALSFLNHEAWCDLKCEKHFVIISFVWWLECHESVWHEWQTIAKMKIETKYCVF